MPLELKDVSGLWLLGLSVPLVLLYLLNRRRRRVVIGSTWLWSEARRDHLAANPIRRLLPRPSLWLELAALCLAALALSRPATRGSSISGDHLAIIVDVSASMAAQETPGLRRIDLARDAARGVIDSLAPGAQAMLIAAGRDAEVLSPFERDRRRLKSALAGLRVKDVEGTLQPALATASERLNQLGGTRRVVLISDGASAETGLASPRNASLRFIRVGSVRDNASIVRFDVQSTLDPESGEERVQAFGLIQNSGSRERDVYVTLEQRNVAEPLASRRVGVAPGERAPVVLTFDPAPQDHGSGLLLRISPSDALPVDDVAFARVPDPLRLPVVMSPPDASPWIQRALMADPQLELLSAPLDALATAPISPDALVIVSGACPPILPGAAFLIENPPNGPCRTAVVGEKIERPLLSSWSTTDTRLRFLSLDGVEVAFARELSLESPGAELVRARHGPVIGDISVSGRQGTLIAFPVAESNWPLKASFVVFLRNIVELARAHRAGGVLGPAGTGDALRVRVPLDVERVEAELPNGSRLELPAHDGLCVLPQLTQAGFYYLSYEGRRPGSLLVAASLFSETEGKLSPRERRFADAEQALGSTSPLEALREWGFVLAFAALVFVALDLWLLARKPRSVLPPTVARPRLPDRPRPLSSQP